VIVYKQTVNNMLSKPIRNCGSSRSADPRRTISNTYLCRKW